MEFTKLQEVNSKLGTVDIKGKAYVEVNKRILAFRELYPNGAIINEMISNENGLVIFKSTIMGDTDVIAVAHAYEKEGAGFINKTSYIENCETSAVGRALGMCGIGVDASVASFEEVANAIKQQEVKKEKVTDKELTVLEDMVVDAGSDPIAVKKAYKIKEFTDMTIEDYYDCIKKLQKKIDGGK